MASFPTPVPTPFEPENDFSVDLAGTIIHLDNGHTGSPASTESDSPRTYKQSNPNKKPNLMGHIKIIEGPLEAGGLCDIYRGDLMSEQSVEPLAIKLLRVFNSDRHAAKAKKKFRREVSLWCSLKHRHVLPFYGTFELDEFRLFMVSSWAEGGSSLEYLRRNPSADRSYLLYQTASALEYLHSGQDVPPIVHGNLKADNVLISAKGNAKLCDFGLSHYVEEVSSDSVSSSASRARGYSRFMAPERLATLEDTSQPSKPTPESDVFAFGSLMLQIYTEKLPFYDLREAQVIVKISRGELPPRPTELVVLERGLDDFMWTVTTDCWEFEPSKRPSMNEVARRMRDHDNENATNPRPQASDFATDLVRRNTSLDPLLIYDTRTSRPPMEFEVWLPPSQVVISRSSSRSSYAALGPRHLSHPAVSPPLRFLRLRCHFLPWHIDVYPATEVVTVGDVLEAIYRALRHNVTEQEWHAAPRERRNGVRDAWLRRCKRQYSHKERAYEESRGLRRVDWLMKNTVFLGLSPGEARDRWEMHLGSGAKTVKFLAGA